MLGESRVGPLVLAPWAGPLISLGARLARNSAKLDGNQLVVAITVPVRDMAATLIACGWALTRTAKVLGAPLQVAERLAPRTPIRMVTNLQVIAGRFYGMQPDPGGPRINVEGTWWLLDHVRYLTALTDLPECRVGKRDMPPQGSLSRKAGPSQDWLARQCAPNTDLAILGTKSMLAEEMTVSVGWGDTSSADQIGDILLPDTDNAPTWATRICAAQRVQELDLPHELAAVILDGSSAIRWIAEVESPILIAVIDRRSPDDAVQESVVHLRSRCEPITLDVLGWTPSCGIEAMAFKAPL